MHQETENPELLEFSVRNGVARDENGEESSGLERNQIGDCRR